MGFNPVNELKNAAQQRFENEMSLVQTQMELFDVNDVVIDVMECEE